MTQKAAQSGSPEGSPEALSTALLEADYVADHPLSVALYLAISLGRPLLVEGPAGTGKTELAHATAQVLGRNLLRLQCYEGLDESRALYEWDYPKQILFTQLLRGHLDKLTSEAKDTQSAMAALRASEHSFFDRSFLLARPLLQAIESDEPVVLLIDEVDRSDPEFEAFLLELLAERQITIPEIGTLRAKHPPLVLLTANGTREMSEALRRRCVHAYLDYPSPERELQIVERKVAGIETALTLQLTRFIAGLRKLDLTKAPSIGESLDWARALLLLGKSQLDQDLVHDTLGVILKHHEDQQRVELQLADLLAASCAPGTKG